MSRQTQCWCGVLTALWLASVCVNVSAATKTWSGSGNWTDANWSPSAPVDGDDVVVSSGNVTLNVTTVYLSSFSNNAPLVFAGWNTILYATNVTVNATITHLVQSDTNGTFNSTNGWDPDNRVYIVCSNLNVAAGKAIDVTGVGYQGRYGASGSGPGGSGNATDNGGPGGSYGGLGGNGYAGTIAGTYGSSNAPVDPGSAGGCPGIQGNGSGTNGGGAVRIVASGVVTVDGAINANGYNATVSSSGGGSGGGIYLDCWRLQGTGVVAAVGGKGAGGYGGGGGGGRIAVWYSDRTRIGAYSVLGGLGDSETFYGQTLQYEGKSGTYTAITTNLELRVGGSPAVHGTASPYDSTYLYSIAPQTWVTNNVPVVADQANGTAYGCIGWQALTNGLVQASGSTTQAVFQMLANTTLSFLWTNQYELNVSTSTNGAVTTASNGWYNAGTGVGGLQATPDSGYQFLQWSGDIPAAMITNNPLTITLDQRRWITAHFGSTTAVYTKTNSVGGDWFAWTNWSPKGIPGPQDTAILAAGTTLLANPTTLSNLTVVSGATLQAGGWDPLLTAFGTIMVSGTVTHAQNSDTNGTYNSTNGWDPDARLNITCAALTVASGGKIDANGKGYQGRVYTLPGCGPGGSNPGGNRGAGGSYGGKGGNSYDVVSANTYGSSNAPVDPGSAGGGYTASNNGKPGGGAIRITSSGDITVNGTLSADGTANGLNGSGGGSGGSVSLTCRNLQGSGALSANGGSGGGYGGGGGGGRIAVIYSGAISLVGITVTGGASPEAGQGIVTPGSNGTYYTQSTGVPLTIGASPAQHGSPTPYGYGAVSVPSGATITNNVNSPADTSNGVRYSCVSWEVRTNGAIYANGSGTQAVFVANQAVTLTYIWTNQYELAVTGAPNGSVTAANGWYTNGTIVAGIQATPNGGYDFLQWSGDVPAGNSKDRPLTLSLTQRRWIVAHFGSSIATITTTNSVGGDWFVWTNWSAGVIPGPRDSVVLPGSAFVSLPVSIGSLAVSPAATLEFRGWQSVMSVAGGIIVSGTVTHATNTDVTGARGVYSDWTPDQGVFLKCQDLTVAAAGQINVDGKGYPGSPTNSPQTGYGPGGGSGAQFWGAGGGYGGPGGQDYGAGPGGVTYGLSNAPVDPGSAGAGQNARPGGAGGGYVMIAATRTVRIDGTLSANGSNPPNQGGGGSGGGVYVACHSLEGGGVVRAKGGNGNNGGGGGGGGRIAIWYDATNLWSGSLSYPASVTNGIRGSAGGQEQDGLPGTLYWKGAPPKGSVILIR